MNTVYIVRLVTFVQNSVSSAHTRSSALVQIDLSRTLTSSRAPDVTLPLINLRSNTILVLAWQNHSVCASVRARARLFMR